MLTSTSGRPIVVVVPAVVAVVVVEAGAVVAGAVVAGAEATGAVDAVVACVEVRAVARLDGPPPPQAARTRRATAPATAGTATANRVRSVVTVCSSSAPTGHSPAKARGVTRPHRGNRGRTAPTGWAAAARRPARAHAGHPGVPDGRRPRPS